MKTRNVKLNRVLSESELLKALSNSMKPLFQHLEEKLTKEGDGKRLDIAITVKNGSIKLEYGVGNI